MLQVTKFIEGGYDLTKHSEVPRCIVVGNGVREVVIPVSEESLQPLVQMYAEEAVKPAVKGFSAVPEAAMADLPEEPVSIVRRTYPAQPAQEMFESPDQPVEFEPGEEYADSGTGVASL